MYLYYNDAEPPGSSWDYMPTQSECLVLLRPSSFFARQILRVWSGATSLEEFFLRGPNTKKLPLASFRWHCSSALHAFLTYTYARPSSFFPPLSWWVLYFNKPLRNKKSIYILFRYVYRFLVFLQQCVGPRARVRIACAYARAHARRGPIKNGCVLQHISPVRC
jgi:hypothetical protein